MVLGFVRRRGDCPKLPGNLLKSRDTGFSLKAMTLKHRCAIRPYAYADFFHVSPFLVAAPAPLRGKVPRTSLRLHTRQ